MPSFPEAPDVEAQPPPSTPTYLNVRPLPSGSRSDGLASFQPLVIALRWGTIMVAAVLIFSGTRGWPEIGSLIVMIAYAGGRTRFPIASDGRRFRAVTEVIGELLLTLGIVFLTGDWQSPFFFSVVVAVLVGGLARGFSFAIPLAGAVIVGIAAPSLVAHDAQVGRLTTVGGCEVTVVALLAGYVRRLFGQAERQASRALSRLSMLNEANDLLLQLHHVAQTLPASLDLGETLASITRQLRELLAPDVSAVLLWDSALDRWSLGSTEGARLPGLVTTTELPVAIQKSATTAMRFRSAVRADLGIDGPGLSRSSRTGVYAPLVSRDVLVGVVAVESRDPEAFTDRHLSLMTGLAEQAALAVDNAQWFSRLRILGAEEERMRIARDLHDRVAQSLAYLAFELDRIVAMSATAPVTAELEALRHDVRGVVTEVRDTLYDLRTDVSENQDLMETLSTFLDRVRSRSGLAVSLEHDGNERLPLPIEREFWRIAQEAATNVERHAGATSLVVAWQTGPSWAELHVTDDGRGFPVGDATRFGSYGLRGMRERADAIGASLEIQSTPGKGTAVRCRITMT